MEEVQTWRELLGKVTNDPQERQRVADALSVNPITLIRWATNKSNPRQDNLRPLLDALPQYRQQFTALIAEEFPHFFTDELSGESVPQDIPSAFYARVLNAHTTSPSMLRASSVSILILQQMLGHLDPNQSGLALIIFQCVPPLDGNKVRSLRMIMGRGTPPWGSHMENRTQFFGAESQAGHTVSAGHLTVIQSNEVKSRLFPVHQTPVEKSTVVSPILLADRVAGCLCIASTQPNYFSQARLDLIQSYTDLLVLAFEHYEFYDLRDVELGIMPHSNIQQPIIATFQQRIAQHMIQAAQNGQHLTRINAERLVWQELEEELLRISLSPDCKL